MNFRENYLEITNNNVEQWKLFSARCFDLLSKYPYLIDSYVLDFFSEDLWSRVPVSWRMALESIDLAKLTPLLCPPEDKRTPYGKSFGVVLPLSLLAFCQASFSCSLRRDPVKSTSVISQFLQCHCSCKLNCKCYTDGTTQQQKHFIPCSQMEKSMSNILSSCNGKETDNSDIPVIAKKLSQTSVASPMIIKESSLPFENISSQRDIFLSKMDTTHRQEKLLSETIQTAATFFQTVQPHVQQDAILWHSPEVEFTKDGQHSLLSHVFRRHIKPKKQHEVARLSLVASMASAAVHCDVTSDIGSGCGHLARLMAYGYNMKVVCVDKEEDFVKGARQFDQQMERSLTALHKRLLTTNSKGSPAAVQLPAGPRHSAHLLLPGVPAKDFAQTVLCKWSHHPPSHGSCCCCNSSDQRISLTNGSAFFEVSLHLHPEDHLDLNNKSPNSNTETQTRPISCHEPQLPQQVLSQPNCSCSSQHHYCSHIESTFDHQTVSLHTNQSHKPSSPSYYPTSFSSPTRPLFSSASPESAFPLHNCCSSPRPSALGLTGLHTCGDLSATMLKVFLEANECRYLASVSCCYMKLTAKEANDNNSITDNCNDDTASNTNNSVIYDKRKNSGIEINTDYFKITDTHDGSISNPNHSIINNSAISSNIPNSPIQTNTINSNTNTVDFGYPLSHYFQRHPGHRLSYCARELACHAIEAYRDRLAVGEDCLKLKVHCYRAALEHILVQHWPQHKRAGLRPVKQAHTKPFHEYAASAVRSLDGGAVQLPTRDLHSSHTKDMLQRWRQVVVFYTLRLLLAPVIETVILLDRCLYLYEQGVNSVLVPIFDPKLSPRNMVLLAIKPRGNGD